MLRSSVLALLVLALAGVARAATQPPKPRCFGAAAADREKPCRNPALRLMARPAPDDALLAPDAPCVFLPRAEGEPAVCELGLPEEEATGGTVAMLGDSHAGHWRAAVDEIAKTRRWRILVIAKEGCPFSAVVRRGDTTRRDACVPFVESVPGWFAARPEISTVFVSAHSGTGYPGLDRRELLAAKVDGDVEALGTLPESVERIVVLADPPIERVTTKDCITAALRARRAPGMACRIPRANVQRPDSLVLAARRVGPPRVQAVDLTHRMCWGRWCYPVVGGALVHKDQHHFTETFSRTLGAPLNRALLRLPAPVR